LDEDLPSTMNRPEDSQLIDVWGEKSPELSREIIDFWLEHKALTSRQQAEQRVPEVIYLARDPSGQIAAVSTIYNKLNPQLHNHFYHFRCFVARSHRRSQVAFSLLMAARDLLNRRFAEGKETLAIGMLMEVENPALQQHRNEAIWPLSRFVYVGKNERGAHIRVFYFDDARIT
jgi:hypothetical protein